MKIRRVLTRRCLVLLGGLEKGLATRKCLILLGCFDGNTGPEVEFEIGPIGVYNKEGIEKIGQMEVQ